MDVGVTIPVRSGELKFNRLIDFMEKTCPFRSGFIHLYICQLQPSSV